MVHTCVRVGEFLLQMYVNECLTNQSMGRELLLRRYAVMYRLEVAISDSYDKCGPGRGMGNALKDACVIIRSTLLP